MQELGDQGEGFQFYRYCASLSVCREVQDRTPAGQRELRIQPHDRIEITPYSGGIGQLHLQGERNREEQGLRKCGRGITGAGYAMIFDGGSDGSTTHARNGRSSSRRTSFVL